MALVTGLMGIAAVATAATYQYRQPANGLVATPVAAPTPAASLVLGGSLPSAYMGQAYSTDLSALLSDANGGAISASEVRWSATGLPAGLQLQGAAIAGSVSSSGAQSITITATYRGSSLTKTYNLVVDSYYASCLQYLTAHPGAASGGYILDVDGAAGPAVAKTYYCDMTSDGGGWTKIVQQTEAAPVSNWDGGANGTSFTLSSAQVPSHTHVGIGYNNLATAIDYVTWTYSTGDIPVTLATSPKTGSQYYIHRSSSQWYGEHDPQGVLGTGTGNVSGTWVGTLTFIKKGGGEGAAAYGWTFAARNENSGYRGYRIYGSRALGSDTGTWTVWVR